MTKLTESDIELFAIELLQELGYSYKWGPEIAPDGNAPERNAWDAVLLHQRLKEAVDRINPDIPLHAREDALKQVTRLNHPTLIANNEAFHHMLTEGIKVTYQKDGSQRGDLVWLVDFHNLSNNDFLVVNQFTVVENSIIKRPDLVLFVNGIPLVVVELKNAADENATLQSAFNQLETYKAIIPKLFTYNGILVISDGLDTKAGSLSAGYTRFMAWKTADGKTEASPMVGQLETLIKGMLNPHTLLDLVRHFIVFENDRKEDLHTGQITIEIVKKLAGYHQYYAVNKAVESTLKASSLRGNRKGGVIWHTQGSGKSLSMVFFTGKLVLSMDNPTIVVITDRNDLDDQLYDTFAASTQLLRQAPVQANSREHLKELLKVASGGIVFTTIHKFSPEEGNVFECLSDRRNIVVIADEAHRTQYGFLPKTLDVQDGEGNVVGKRVVYGFAKYMRDALPNATYLGFTGTPIENADVNTPAVFGNYVDVYDIAQAVEDGATVRIYYESRLAKIRLSEEGKKLISELDQELDTEDLDEAQRAKAKWTQLEALVGSKDRIAKLAKDIVTHFEARQEVFEGKGMIVTMSRRIAVDLYQEIIKIRPEWHNDDMSKGAIKIIMTAASSDGPGMAKHHTTKDQRRALSERMKDNDNELKLVIVRDMWLTGFDAPSLHTMYLDKPMKGHGLMQAIARVNRVYKDKPGGLVVDYLGIAPMLKEALANYTQNGSGRPMIPQEEAVSIMLEKYEIVKTFYHSFDYSNFFTLPKASERTRLISAAIDYVLGQEDGKKRYIQSVAELSQAFSLSIPNEEAIKIRDEVAFFQAVKSGISKIDTDDVDKGKTDEDYEHAIRQIVSNAIISDKVIDIFNAVGMNKPNIAVLSDEFLEDVKNMEHKNLAFEALKKLLSDSIKTMSRTNLVKSRSFAQMLEMTIKKYQNQTIESAQIIAELIELAKKIREEQNRGKKLGLNSDEVAFYEALADNESAAQVLGDDTLKKIAIELVELVRKNVTIDWTIRESVQARLRVYIRRLLNKYGYPPDKQEIATKTVLEQAELLCKDWGENLEVNKDNATLSN